LFSRKQQSRPRGDDRERIMQARQAAEALFTKPQVGTPSVSEVGPTVKTARKPRVLPMISPLVPVLPDESETAIALSPQMRFGWHRHKNGVSARSALHYTPSLEPQRRREM
jgi:hypothetical protein